MNILEPILIGLDQLRSHRMRASLSILGILLSVGSVTGIVSMGDGLKKTVMTQFEQMGGSSLIWVSPPQTWYRKGNSWIKREWEEYLTIKDVENIHNASPYVKLAVPLIRTSSDKVFYRDVSAPSQVFATTDEYREIDNIEVQKGRSMTSEDVKSAAKVAMIGDTLADDLFAKVDPIGKEIRIDNIRYTVIGVMVRKRAFDNSTSRYMAIPITTQQLRVSGNNRVQSINVRADAPGHVEEVSARIRSVIRATHEHAEDFRVETGESQIAQFNRVVSILKLVAGGIAGISLIVGGIGIMNIMLVSVTERTREIGIRMAVGAKRRSILAQFILEAIALCLAGGALGILLGLGIGAGISAYVKSVTHQPFESVVTPGLMMFAVLYSAGIGLFFGVYPAWRASKLDPVEALRHE
jgi:putative ABC transport system permease protein